MRAAGFRNGAYGDYDLFVYLSKTGYLDQYWQTYAWSNGKFFTGSGFYQWRINEHCGSVSADYDQIIDPKKLGAFWPKGTDPNRVIPKPTLKPVPVEEDEMKQFNIVRTPKHHYYLVDGINVRWLNTLDMVKSTQAWLTHRGGNGNIEDIANEIVFYYPAYVGV